ncbi:coiled-coil domain-containing protein 18 [Seriola dumerili]|uniref:coiled-coil domain-containing protein 18 n=1 Tax=Seriola dumerili TaxID=41447 RepID=UPI000BBE07FB|nr:coiled-coil domain-containing protein 18 [Seriola dumerili]
MFEYEESLTQDVVNLRNLLRLTDHNLRSVGQKLSPFCSHAEGHDGDCEQQSPHRLTLRDLQTPDVPLSQSGCVWQEGALSGTAERPAFVRSLSPPFSNSTSASVKIRSVDMETISLRKKLGCALRQENACLAMQDEQLISDIDAMQYELATSKSQLHLRGPRVGVKNNVAVMSEQIRQLQAELEAQAKELKAAELRAECSQEAAAHNDIVVASVTEELGALRDELDNKTALGKRAEQQRNQALENAEKLKEAFKDYKATISIKLRRVMESESNLKESLIECDREKEELEMKCTVLQREKKHLLYAGCHLKEEVKQAKCSAAESSDLQAQLEEARQRASLLERQLVERGAECRELASLRRELEDLRTVTQSQEQKVAQSHREAQQSQAELSSLENILALLHLQEGAVWPLCARPCMLPPVDYSGTAHLLKLKPGEGYQQLLRVLQSTEAERTKQSSVVERLQERLRRAQEEISSLQSSMAQRASHYQSLHTELLDKVSQATDTEKELKRKSARVSALEKQLQEKTSAYSQAALKNTELENQLLEKTSTLQHYQSLMTKKQREYQQSLDKCKKSQSQQCMEQQHRIEMLQLSVEEAQSRVLEMEQELCLLQRARDEAQKAALVLQTTVEQLTQEKQVEVRHHEELLQSFKEQAAQSATKVCELQSSLSACREELASYLQQMEEVKSNYESELQKSNHKVSSLQEKLHSTSLVCQSSSEQNLQLQLSLQQQQTMLTESTAHISELEEGQSQLQRQVSSLEQQLERARASLQDEVRNREQDAREKDKNLQEMNQQNTQLSESVTHLTSEMTKSRGELHRLRKDVSVRTSQITCMEESLQHTKNQLDRKTDMVVDLEEKLHRCEADQLNCVQQVQMLEGQLQVVREELADTLEQLQKLKDILQRTQTIADERQASVEKLTVQLSETQRELEERTHEVLDMDNALKERQGELQQRAQLLGQLDVAIREHKQEMERKVESLQQSLETRERELRDAQRELTDRNIKESQQLHQQLRVCQQRLQTVLQELEETQHHCEALTREIDTAKLQTKETEVRLCGVEEELVLKEAHWLQSEARLKGMVTSLEQELELEKEQHSRELESLQQTRGQLLKVSEQISSTMRSSQEQLTAKLQQSEAQLEQAKAAQLQTQLQACEKSMETSNESMLIKESEVTRLHARISSLERAADRQNLYNHTLSLPAPNKFTHSPQRSSSAHSPPSSPTKPQTTVRSPAHTHSSRLQSPTYTQGCSSPHACTYLQPASLPNLSVSHQTHDWLQSSSINSSLDLPLSLKATLREALSKQPWESSSSSSVSPFPHEVDRSWQGLSVMETTPTSDLSFNPLTYMVDKQDDGNPNMEEEEVDMSSLTGMLRFVNQTLAMQEDRSLWSSTGLSQSAAEQPRTPEGHQ